MAFETLFFRKSRHFKTMRQGSNHPSVPREFLLERQLGSGSYSQVWSAMHVALRKRVAIKIIPKQSLQSAKAKQRLTREIENHKKLQHPYIASLFSVTENIFHYFLVLEFVPGGTLQHKIANGGALSENDARHYFVQLLSAIDYLHNQKHCAHRDLKADNIVIDENNNIRLIDFGFSKIFDKGEDPLSTLCGSPRYAAPEMFKKGAYTTEVDIWSMGIILYVMVTGRFPFDDCNLQRLAHMIIKKDPMYPLEMSPELINLLEGMLMKEPKDRLTIEDIYQHPWIKNQKENVIGIDEASIFQSSESLLNKITKREQLSIKIAGKNPSSNLDNDAFSNDSDMFPKMGDQEDEERSKYEMIITKLCSTGKFKIKDRRRSDIRSEGVQLANKIDGSTNGPFKNPQEAIRFVKARRCTSLVQKTVINAAE